MARDEQVHYGAGGKALRRSRFGRVRSGPCDRPLSGRHAPRELRAAADPRRESWFSKIVGSPARILKDSASWFISSLFGKSLPAIGPAPEDDSEANEINDIQENEEPNDIQENEEPETEELYQKEERDPAYNFQTPMDDVGALVEIAKAYMEGRLQPRPNCLGIQKKPLLNDNTPKRSVVISSVCKPIPLHFGSDQIDQRTPLNFKFDSCSSNFSGTPHGRSVHKQNSLKRKSYVLLEDRIAANRRIRQKLHNRNSENTFRTIENESQIFARATRVPPRSSELARKILEKLEKMDSDDEGNGNHTSLSPSATTTAIPSFNTFVSSTHKKDCEQAKLDIPLCGVSKSIVVSKSLPFSTSDTKSLIQFSTSDTKSLIQSGNESGSQSNSSSFSFPVIPTSTITEPPPMPKLESLGVLSTMKAKKKRLSAVRVAAVMQSLLQQQLPQTPALNRKLRHSHGQLLSPMGIKALRLSLSKLQQSSLLVTKIQRLVNQANQTTNRSNNGLSIRIRR